MNKRFGLLLIVTGLLLIAGAVTLYLYNIRLDRMAGEQSQAVMEQMKAETPVPVIVEQVSPTPALPKDTMPVVEIDGNEYIGYVAVPVLGLELPVMADWSYDKLNIAPCRHTGASFSKDLVIAAHNYDKHFGRLKALQQGDTVTFTDMDGDVYTYAVDVMETVAPTAVEQVLESGYPLVLYTCTYGGKARVVVYCNIIE